MPDNPNQDPGGSAVLPLVNQPGSFDIESLLVDLVRTEAGAASVAKALKDRRTRDFLRQHGVKIQAIDDVGYNSLPLELRDNIRKCTIALVQAERAINQCGSCPRLAPYACINSEWRDAIEPITFQCLTLRGKDGILDDVRNLELYVVGNRRQHLQQLCLPNESFRETYLLAEDLPEQNRIDLFILPFLQLFNCIKQWQESPTVDGDLHVSIQRRHCFGRTAPLQPELVHEALTNLPSLPQITYFCAPIWEPIDAASMLTLLSCMPNLRSTTIILETAELLEHEQPGQEQYYRSQTQLFFNSLSETVPKLEALEVKFHDAWRMGNHRHTFCAYALSFSQRLRKFSLEAGRGSQPSSLRSILAPFSAENFNPDAPPPLAWPNLTDFSVTGSSLSGFFRTPQRSHELAKEINELLSTVGRAIRHMPCIQNLEFELAYYCHTKPDDWEQYDCRMDIILNLESLRDCPNHRPLAKLFVTHRNFGLNFPEPVPSEEVRDLWKESLLHAANAFLEVEVICEGQEAGSGLVAVEVEDLDDV